MKKRYSGNRHRICGATVALLLATRCYGPQAVSAQSYNQLAQVSKWRAPGPVTAVAFSPDDKLLAGATRGAVTLWNSAGQQLQQLSFQEDATGAQAGGAQPGRSVSVRQIVFSPDGKMLAAAGITSSVRVWDITNGKLLFDLRGHDRNGARAIAFSPNGTMLASGGYDRLVKLWDVRSGALIRTLEGHGGIVSSLAFERDGRTLATISAEKTGAANCELKRWDASSGKLIGGGTLDYVDPYTAVLSPTARVVGSQIFDPLRPRPTQDRLSDGVRLWDAQSGAVLRSTGGTAGFKGASSLVFSPSGAIIANVIASEYGGQEGSGFSLWDIRTGRSLAYEGNAPKRIYIQAQPLALTFTKDARAIAVGCADSTVQVWALPE